MKQRTSAIKHLKVRTENIFKAVFFLTRDKKTSIGESSKRNLYFEVIGCHYLPFGLIGVLRWLSLNNADTNNEVRQTQMQALFLLKNHTTTYLYKEIFFIFSISDPPLNCYYLSYLKTWIVFVWIYILDIIIFLKIFEEWQRNRFW